MELILRMNDALNYIEENLTNEMDYGALARVAACSSYHFSRLFSSVTGVPLSEYIRRRRLTLAAVDLQGGELKVIDLALKYGYDSPDSFCRAFKTVHGITPSRAKEQGSSLKCFPKLSIQVQIIGVTEVEYRIEVVDAEMTIVGRTRTVKTKAAFREVPSLWSEAKRDGLQNTLIDLSWENPQCQLESLLGVCGSESSIRAEQFEYFLGVRYQGEVPEGLSSMTLPAATWAVFPNVVDAWKRIYTEWLPHSGYDLADLPCVECYYPPEHSPRHELWVPVVRT